MGLLGDYLPDFLPADQDKREAARMGLLNFGAQMLANANRGFGGALGTGLLGGAESYQQAQEQQRTNKMHDLKLAQVADQQADQQKVRDFYGSLSQFMPSQSQQALDAGANAGSVGPTVANAARIPQMPQQTFDANSMYRAMLASGSPTLAAQGMQGLSKQEEAFTLSPGQKRFKGQNLVAEVAPETKLPDGMRMGPNGPEWIPGYIDGKSSIGRAGATNVVLPKIEVKTGESIAGQVGPILKGTRDQAIAGIKLVDSSQRVLDAAEKGNLYAGPTATLRLRGAQIADTLGIGGKDTTEKIANTRSVVRGMAEQAVAARSQLGGQAQISNAEQELINRATSGDISDLTVPEIVQIAKMNDRLGRQMYEGHQMYLNQMNQNPNLQGLTGFYKVPEMTPPRKAGAAAGGIKFMGFE